MEQTPHHVSVAIDSVLDELNAIWNLELPRLYGNEARLAENNSPKLAWRCSSRIRFLCWRDAGIKRIIGDFEEEAKHIVSSWVWKPSQEKGTLPSRPQDGSFLRRDIMSGKLKMITPERRMDLLRKLDSILDQEYILAQNSECYQRTSSQDDSNSMPRINSFSKTKKDMQPPKAPTKSVAESMRPVPKLSPPTKRRKILPEPKGASYTPASSSATNDHNSKVPIEDFFKASKFSSQKLASGGKVDISTSNSHYRGSTIESGTGKLLPASAVTSFDTSTSFVPSVWDYHGHASSPDSDVSSIISTKFEDLQGYFPTQDAKIIMNDDSFRTELDNADAIGPKAQFSLKELDKGTPFKRLPQLPTDLPFWLRWEVYRIGHFTGIMPNHLWETVKGKIDMVNLTYEEAWNVISAACREQSRPPPPKSDLRPWVCSEDVYQSVDGHTVYFSFNLEFEPKPGPYLWKLILNPIKIDKGNRLHRKFGADRHVIGFLNYFDRSTLPKWVTEQKNFDEEVAFQKIGSWLATQTHHIAGREWRAFYLEPESTKNKRKSGQLPRQKLSFFAIDGIDFGKTNRQKRVMHEPFSIAQLIDWHIPLHTNLDTTDLKLFSRFGLALSKTRATVTLEPHEFHYLPDQEPVMNDGCALVSKDLATAIWDICGDGGKDVPSAFQARIGGGKGLWIIDYRSFDIAGTTADRWIQISDSQLKIKPHPRDRTNADEYQRTFEVLKWSSSCSPGHLNMQLINILADRGVPRSILRQAVLNDIEAYIEDSKAAMRDPGELQAWLQEYHTPDCRDEPVFFDTGLPEMREDEACFLVQSGFTAENCEHLRHSIISLMTQRLNTYVEKLRIEISHSTSTFCIPDLYQILEPGEVYLGFSNHWENPKTGLKESALDNIEVLVARNPAALASDIQKVRAVYKHELRHFKDVIIFSTKGRIPLASILSGGDYDGDTVTVIWDPAIVDNFDNTEKPELPNEGQCGLRKVSRKLEDIIKNMPPSPKVVDEFLTSCILFNARPSRLGMCTTEHEKLIYSGAKLSDPGSILLAALAGYLVDANKQGLSQTDSSWVQIRKTAQAGRKLLELAYKSGPQMPRSMASGECVNIIDHLKYDVAMKRKEDILKEFTQLLPDASNYNRELVIPYKQEQDRVNNKNDTEHQDVADILTDLNNKLDAVSEEWLKRVCKREDNDRVNLSAEIKDISRLVQEITPLQRQCDIYRDFVSDDCGRSEANLLYNNSNIRPRVVKGTRWSLLRASAMYTKFYKRRITWWVVGDELCRIKARSSGSTRELPPATLHFLKADTKLIKRHARGLKNVEDGDE